MRDWRIRKPKVPMSFSLFHLCSNFLLYDNYFENIPNVVFIFLSPSLPLIAMVSSTVEVEIYALQKANENLSHW